MRVVTREEAKVEREALSALQAAMCIATFFPGFAPRTGQEIAGDRLPGRAVMRLGPEARGQLSKLTSAHLENTRPHWL